MDATTTSSAEPDATSTTARPTGLSSREAERRLVAYGRNELTRRRGRRWPRDLLNQLVHPLATLLWVAAGLAFAAGMPVLAAAIVVVILLNAAFAFAQEQQAERSIDALRRYLPQAADVLRDGRRVRVDAASLVPGDLVFVGEGDRISADGRILAGALEVDLSMLTGESQPVLRTVDGRAAPGNALEARNVVFSGTMCVGGEGRVLVTATGMHTQIGRIAALTEGVAAQRSPLEDQVRRAAWLIAVVAVAAGGAFLPIGRFAAGLPLDDALSFAIGLIVANVPEGLLPTITLALAVGVAQLARRGALVKRLSAIGTLGSATVICTDKTGTLTENRMRPRWIWTPAGETDLEAPLTDAARAALRPLGRVIAACSSAELGGPRTKSRGDATEVGMLEAARAIGVDTRAGTRERRRRALFRFDPALRLMTTVDDGDAGLVAHVKGAPEAVLGRSELPDDLRAEVGAKVEEYARSGLRVLAVAERPLDAVPAERALAERRLTFLGLVALFDPPRAEVPDAVARCRTAGIRIIVVTGDYGPTAVAIARRVGIATSPHVITGEELDAMPEQLLDRLLADPGELVFARSSPEAKLRIADALRAHGEVVAMTGDGVNDAPALRRAHLGIAMGESGTDVAREAATMVLTDDNFATIVSAVEAGRQVFDNVRKFVLYIFAHATPEVVPFLVFALSGGAVPLPLTVLQILAIDLGTEILPALALGREAPEPGLMLRPPRAQHEGVIDRALLVRAWVLLGAIEAALVLGGFFEVLLHAGWRPGDAVDGELHHAYLQATTMTFAGIVACQVGTAVAARTDRASLRAVGIFTNRLLVGAIGSEIAFAAAVVYAPPLQHLFDTAALRPTELLLLAAFPFVVWSTDELRRARLRRRREGRPAGSVDARSEAARLPDGRITGHGDDECTREIADVSRCRQALDGLTE